MNKYLVNYFNCTFLIDIRPKNKAEFLILSIVNFCFDHPCKIS